MPSIRAVLFDMDGVLVEVSGSYRRAIEETAAHFTGRPVTTSAIQRYKNAGGFNDDWRLTYALISDAGVEVSFSRVVDEFQRRYRGADWDGFIRDEPSLVPDDLFERLGPERLLAVVTGRPRAEALWTIRHRDWTASFPLVVALEDQDGRGKPDPFPIRFALARLAGAGRSVEPSNAVYVGDTVDDMVAARTAGLWAVGFVPPSLRDQAHEAVLVGSGAHAVLQDLRDLPACLATLGADPDEPTGSR